MGSSGRGGQNRGHRGNSHLDQWVHLSFQRGGPFLLINALIYIIVSLLPLKPSEHIEWMFLDEVEEFIEETA
jgi:hypothetical protein